MKKDVVVNSHVAGYSLACDCPVSLPAVETSHDRAAAFLKKPGLYDCLFQVFDQQGLILKPADLLGTPRVHPG